MIGGQSCKNMGFGANEFNAEAEDAVGKHVQGEPTARQYAPLSPKQHQAEHRQVKTDFEYGRWKSVLAHATAVKEASYPAEGYSDGNGEHVRITAAHPGNPAQLFGQPYGDIRSHQAAKQALAHVHDGIIPPVTDDYRKFRTDEKSHHCGK